MKGIIYFGAIAVIFALALGDIFATESTTDPSDEFQSNRLVLAGDAAPMDTDIERMGACEDLWDTKKCKKIFKKGQCDSKKAEKYCKKTCGLCKDYCEDTLEKLHCLSECPTPVAGSNASNYHHILGRCYYFQATRMNFTEAMENCTTIFGTKKKNTGRLFEPRNSEVNDAVGKKAGETIASDPEGSMWIGIRTDSNLTINSTDRDFFYLSGGPYTRLPYGQWFEGEPNNANGDIAKENCVQMYTLPINSNPNPWNDIRCDDEYPSICEMGNEVIW